MSLSYTKTPVIFGAVLQILRKIEARIDQAIKSDSSSYDPRLLVQSNGLDTSVTVDKTMLGRQIAFFDGDLQQSLRGAWKAYRALLEGDEDFFGFLKAGLDISADDRGAGAIEYVYDKTNDNVSIVNRLGYLGALYNDMIAQSQYVTGNTVTLGSLTAKSTNRGLLTASSKTALSHLLSGTLIFEVTDDTVDQPKLSVTHEPSVKTYDELATIASDNDLAVDKTYEDGPTGLSALFVRTGLSAPVITGDDDDLFTAFTVATPKGGDMSGGVLQVRVTRKSTSPIWLVEFFSDSSRSTKVGRFMTDTTSGTYSFDETLKNGTRVQGTFDRAAAHAALAAAGDEDDDISVDIQTPKIGDRWTVSVSNNYAGNFATRIAQAWRVSLPVAGSNLWTDSKAAAVSIS